LGTQEIERRQAKQKTQQRNLTRWATWTSPTSGVEPRSVREHHQHPGLNPGAWEGQSIHVSYKTHAMVLIW
jgi:hypothetical protein